MSRSLWLDLAASGRPMPIATHLVLHEHAGPDSILLDGMRLAGVMSEAADRFLSRIALPVMDLALEKALLLATLKLGDGDPGKYHFHSLPSRESADMLRERIDPESSPRMAANLEAIKIIAAEKRLAPIGMSIGPFSLLSKLLDDPITPIYLAGSGLTADDDADVALLYSLLELAEIAIAASCHAQLEAGALAIFVCEPAANTIYFSPKQFREGSDVFDTFVIQPNLRLRELISDAGADLIFHDCGDLIPEMVQAFGALDPVMLSLGSSVKLWDIEPYVAKDVVLYGNLPTKKFYSDDDVPLESVATFSEEIRARLRALKHPFIIGSECDILSMPGYERKIMAKVERFCCPGHYR